MRFGLLLLGLFCASTLWSQATYNEPIAMSLGTDLSPRILFTEGEWSAVRSRLSSMESIIGKHDHPVTESYVQSYMLRQREKAETILGRIPTYFPLFEEELRKAGLPDDLKYLAVVESALDPTAHSRSGAGGLWQFMPGTAAMFDLTVNNTLDERSDVEKSTRAAVKFLKDEYARFGDWALVLAAYNGGPGRVRRAMRRSGKRDFWELRRYLPRETRNYVPAFVAAVYLHKYGDLHGLQPIVPLLDQQLVTAVACPFGVSLHEVAQATELSLDLISQLNPHCRKGYVPAGFGASCRVPTRTAAALQAYLKWRVEGTAPELVSSVQQRSVASGLIANTDHLYVEERAVIEYGSSLSRFAQDQGVSLHHLLMWNPSLSTTRSPSSEVVLYRPRFVPESPVAKRPDLHLSPTAIRPIYKFYIAPPVLPDQLEYRLPNATTVLRKHQSLLEAWQPYAETTTWKEFASWNKLDAGTVPKVGQPLKVRQ